MHGVSAAAAAAVAVRSFRRIYFTYSNTIFYYLNILFRYSNISWFKRPHSECIVSALLLLTQIVSAHELSQQLTPTFALKNDFETSSYKWLFSFLSSTVRTYCLFSFVLTAVVLILQKDKREQCDNTKWLLIVLFKYLKRFHKGEHCFLQEREFSTFRCRTHCSKASYTWPREPFHGGKSWFWR